MEAVIFVGLQGSGKSTFYEQRFARTHTRINLDRLKTRFRERTVLEGCISERKDFVVDNTNPTVADRKRYLEPAKAAGYRVIGYFFDCPIEQCLERNRQRSGKERVPVPALFGTRKRLQPPTLAEGFDALFTVHTDNTGQFVVSPKNI